MALRHVRAAQKQGIEDPVAMSVLQVIATDIGHDDSPAFPSYRTIAERAGCHYNTVSDRVSQLAEQGHITIEKKGRRQYYNVTFKCDNNEGDYHKTVTPTKDNQAGDVTQYVTKEELSQLLSQFAAEIVTALSQQMAHIVTEIVTNYHTLGVTEVEDKKIEVNPQTPNGVGVGSDQHSKRQAVVSLLVEEFGFTPPSESDSATWEEWLADVDVLLSLKNNHVTDTIKHIVMVKEYMDKNGLSYSRPKSFVTIARRFVTNPPESDPSNASQAASRKAELIFDWLVKQGQEYGRMRFKEWGVTEEVRNIANESIGYDFPEKVSGQNPYQYQKDFVNEYAKQQSSATA